MESVLYKKIDYNNNRKRLNYTTQSPLKSYKGTYKKKKNLQKKNITRKNFLLHRRIVLITDIFFVTERRLEVGGVGATQSSTNIRMKNLNVSFTINCHWLENRQRPLFRNVVQKEQMCRLQGKRSILSE